VEKGALDTGVIKAGDLGGTRGADQVLGGSRSLPGDEIGFKVSEKCLKGKADRGSKTSGTDRKKGVYPPALDTVWRFNLRGAW